MDEILQFFNDNKDALTAIGIILTFLVSVASLYFPIRNNKAVHYVNSVTKSRVEWIEKLRLNIAKFTVLTRTDDITTYSQTAKEMAEKDMSPKIIAVKELGTEIKLQLNFSGKLDRKLIEYVDAQIIAYEYICLKISNLALTQLKNQADELFIPDEEILKVEDEMVENAKNVEKYAQVYLKAEWNRVKYESQGKTYEKGTQEFDVDELEEKYNNPDYKNDVWKRFCINLKAKILRIWNSAGFSVFLVVVCIICIIATVPCLFRVIKVGWDLLMEIFRK